MLLQTTNKQSIMHNIGPILAVAIGDAYGRPFEFAPEEYLDVNDGKRYHPAPGGSADDIGYYTDDTQQTIAIAEHMLACAPQTHEAYMSFFIEAYKRDIRGGYSRRMKGVLGAEYDENNVVPSALEAVSKLHARNSNGSVMRAIPLGFYPSIHDVKKAAIMSATATHPTTECINATMIIALASHYYYYRIKSSFSLKYFLFEHMDIGTVNEIFDYWRGGIIQCDATTTASYCLNFNSLNGSMSDVLKTAVAVGGDVDSTAAICMGLAALKGLKNDLSMDLTRHLENKKYGYDFLLDLDQRLAAKFPRPE
jgi:ADP-ribosyl-[dinitrogen reductase] hydrolase